MKKLMKPFVPLMLMSCLLMGLSTQLFASNDDRLKQLEDDFKILEQRLIFHGPQAEKDRIKEELEKDRKEGRIAYTLKFLHLYREANVRAQRRGQMSELVQRAEDVLKGNLKRELALNSPIISKIIDLTSNESDMNQIVNSNFRYKVSS